ncbi:DUF58 domain-containing protein [Methyloterricola oryzae]|uniref:DUF58 domain-containing protein n=1 Tax=Methyloterricola oryzae TaxID=1495050 RepID=UPI0005EB16A2|nr:VWA domain-containing protein [Methyloterricola oryzae]
MSSREFDYRIRWRASGVHPGAHHGSQAGAGQWFLRLAPFMAQPDPRRLDLRSSLCDPFEHFNVRLYEQRSRIEVHAVIDLSASMGYEGASRKLNVLADFMDSLALSCHRTGDLLGVAAFSESGQPEFLLPPTRQLGACKELNERLRDLRLHGTNARGLLQAARYLPARRGLVFLLSDFHFPLSLLKSIMSSLVRHDTVPVVLWDPDEQSPPGAGLARLTDLENGAERMLWLRPELRERLTLAYRERRSRLTTLLRRFGREPLFLDGRFDPEQVSRYFAGTA